MPTYARIKVYRKAAPCTLSFNYEGDDRDITVIMSLKNCMPTEKNCDLKRRKPTKINFMDEEDSRKFKDKYLYVVLKSEKLVRVSLEISFSY